MGKPSQVCKDVYVVGGPETSHLYDCCVYLVDADDLILIDSGAGLSCGQLTANITRLGFDTKRLKALVVTHCHIDHVGGLHELRQKFGLQVIAHQLDTQAIETGRGVLAEFYGVPYHPCPVDIKLTGAEETQAWGRHTLQFLHIPGHTPGGIAILLDVGKKVLFGQDIHGPYYPQWGADPGRALVSLKKLASLQADILCEGHFGIYEPAAAVKDYIESYVHELERGA